MYYLTYFYPEMHQGFLMNDLWDAQTKAEYGVALITPQYYDFHDDWIRRVVPKERLLEFKADGCPPLCDFLGKEKPPGEYPHRNDAKAANQIIRSLAMWGVGMRVVVTSWAFGMSCGRRSETLYWKLKYCCVQDQEVEYSIASFQRGVLLVTIGTIIQSCRSFFASSEASPNQIDGRQKDSAANPLFLLASKCRNSFQYKTHSFFRLA
jgi:hypothetical protein